MFIMYTLYTVDRIWWSAFRYIDLKCNKFAGYNKWSEYNYHHGFDRNRNFAGKKYRGREDDWVHYEKQSDETSGVFTRRTRGSYSPPPREVV